MKNIADYSYKLVVVGLLAFIAYKQHLQTNKSSYSQSVWIEGGEIKAQIINDEKSKIPTTAELESIKLKDNSAALPVTVMTPPVTAEAVQR